eukprot:s2533_g4.t1
MAGGTQKWMAYIGKSMTLTYPHFWKSPHLCPQAFRTLKAFVRIWYEERLQAVQDFSSEMCRPNMRSLPDSPKIIQNHSDLSSMLGGSSSIARWQDVRRLFVSRDTARHVSSLRAQNNTREDKLWAQSDHILSPDGFFTEASCMEILGYDVYNFYVLIHYRHRFAISCHGVVMRPKQVGASSFATCGLSFAQQVAHSGAPR